MKIYCDNLFGIEDGFFTREDLTDYIEGPLEDLICTNFNLDYSQVRVESWIEDDKELSVDCYITLDIEDRCFTHATAYVDFRKIRKPSDLGKYTSDLGRQIEESYASFLLSEDDE